MAKLLFKESPFTNTVMSSLDSSLEYLNQASRQIYSMGIPYGFSESANLKNCFDGINYVKSEIANLKSWGIDSCKKLDLVLQNTNSVAILLPKSQICIRSEVVR